MKHSTISYTTKDGIKEKVTMPFGHPIEAKLFISDLELDDCTDITVETDGVLYNSESERLQKIISDIKSGKEKTTSLDDVIKELGIDDAKE